MRVTKIHAVSRASLKINDVFYTFEYMEERQIDEGDDVDEVVKNLWETVHNEVEVQVGNTLDGTK